MSSNQRKAKVAILDDYQRIALDLADWTVLNDRADVAVFHDHIADPDKVVARLAEFDVLCVMRERTPLPRSIIERLPNLRLIASTGARNAAIDQDATKERGIDVVFTGYDSAPTIEFTWALILASARNIAGENLSLKSGGWQLGIGTGLRGKILGVLGLGRVGSEVARIGQAFGMKVIAWSQNLTTEKAEAVGAELVSREELFTRADILTIHLVLSERSRGLVGAAELARMKPTARLINTSRGPIVDEAALIDTLEHARIAGAAIDVFDVEPLPADHPLRSLDRLLATPHLGYVADDLYRTFYQDSVTNISKWLDTRSEGE